MRHVAAEASAAPNYSKLIRNQSILKRILHQLLHLTIASMSIYTYQYASIKHNFCKAIKPTTNLNNFTEKKMLWNNELTCIQASNLYPQG